MMKTIFNKLRNKELIKESGDFKGELPSHCPICHEKIVPTPLFDFSEGNKAFRTCFCPNCKNAFVATYEFKGMRYKLIKEQKKEPEKIKFSEFINAISTRFEIIYNQSIIAQNNNLDEISGVGFRKSLEVLIKDYAIYLQPESKQKIIKETLGKCIDKYIDDENIKILAKGSSYIGNSETHYVRNIDDPNLDNLKSFIQSIIDIIEAKEKMKKAFEIINKDTYKK